MKYLSRVVALSLLTLIVTIFFETHTSASQRKRKPPTKRLSVSKIWNYISVLEEFSNN